MDFNLCSRWALTAGGTPAVPVNRSVFMTDAGQPAKRNEPILNLTASPRCEIKALAFFDINCRGDLRQLAPRKKLLKSCCGFPEASGSPAHSEARGFSFLASLPNSFPALTFAHTHNHYRLPKLHRV